MKFVSSFRPERTGTLGPFLDMVFAFVPLMYMCVCTYYSLFKVGRLMFYSLTPRQTSAVSLLMICSMVARYAPPVSYNFLNLISLGGNKKTIFERRMGNIDEAVPFFGDGFNRIYPLIMVIYTILVASNFFDRIISFFGNWKIFRLHTEADDMDGFDPSGLILIALEKVLLINFLKQFFGKKFDDSVTNFEKSFRTAFIALASINDWTNRIEEHLAAYAPVIEQYVMQKTRSNELGHWRMISRRQTWIFSRANWSLSEDEWRPLTNSGNWWVF